MNVDADSIDKENSTKNIKQVSDFILLIKQENIDKNTKNFTQKKWFSGYLAILNLSLCYESNMTQIIYNNVRNFKSRK